MEEKYLTIECFFCNKKLDYTNAGYVGGRCLYHCHDCGSNKFIVVDEEG